MYTNKSFMTAKPKHNILEFMECPLDSVSAIAFSLDGAAMAVSSWDGTVSVYTMSSCYATGSFGVAPQPCTPKRGAVHALGKPALSTAFFGNTVLAGLADGSIACVDPSGRIDAIPAHSAGVKVLINYNNQFVVSGSFDASLKFWDLKSAQPIHTIPLPGKIYSASLAGAMLCIALSDKSVHIFDMNNINSTTSFMSRFTFPLRSVGCAHDGDSFAVGGVEAKIELFSRTNEAKRFIIRHHREGNRLFSVNVLAFHPTSSNIIVSGGADGTLAWCDRHCRTKLVTMNFDEPITAGCFSPDARFFVFASGDDWSKGYTGSYIKPVLRIVDLKSIPELNK